MDKWKYLKYHKYDELTGEYKRHITLPDNSDYDDDY